MLNSEFGILDGDTRSEENSVKFCCNFGVRCRGDSPRSPAVGSEIQRSYSIYLGYGLKNGT